MLTKLTEKDSLEVEEKIWMTVTQYFGKMLKKSIKAGKVN